MVELWFAILCLMITLFVVLAGWDIGAGALHFVVARNQEERRALIAAIGPLWTWNEVWLVTTGGVLFVAFPRVMAISFPAYYLALFLVLWTLILRGISLGIPRTHSVRPVAFFLGLRVRRREHLAGDSLRSRHRQRRPRHAASDRTRRSAFRLFTDFGVRGMLGILDWYTLSMAVFTLVCLGAHGAAYLALKTEGDVRRRSKRFTKWLWLGAVFLLLVISLETFYVRPELFAGIADRPAAWIGLALMAGGLAAIFTGLRSAAEARIFVGGCVLIAGLLGTAAASLFPVMLYSTVSPEYSITAYNGSSDLSSLRTASYWWPLALALTWAYFWFVAKHYRGRVRTSPDPSRPY